MADPRWPTTILNFRSLLLPIAFSRRTSVSLLLVHKMCDIMCDSKTDHFTNIIDILCI